jgi:hypothetical protein
MEKEKLSPTVRAIEGEMSRIEKAQKAANLSSEIDRSKTGQGAQAIPVENFPVYSSQDSTQRIGILEINKEQTIKKLAEEIKRISWLDENTSGIEKFIPGIGLDLRASNINKMLREEYKLEPGTEMADQKMNELYEIWARQWMDALENQKKKQKVGEKTEAPVVMPESHSAVIKPMPAARPPVEAPAPVAAAQPEEEIFKKKPEKHPIELNEEQQKTFEELVKRSGIKEMQEAFEPSMKDLNPGEREKREKRNASLVESIENVFKHMISGGKILPGELEYFKEKFLRPELLKRYQENRREDKLSDRKAIENHRQEFIEAMREIAEKKDLGNFSEEAGDMVRSYFSKYTLLEKRLFIILNNIK